MAVDPPAIAARRVGRLHVRARSRQDVQQAAVLIGDALNTASLPGAGRERLIVIRRLALGRISVRHSAASVALRLEHAAREAATEAVSIESPGAGAANAVIFTDRAQALSALARTLSGGGGDEQWFWPMIVPGWTRTLGRGARWVHLMDAAHGGADATVVAAAVLEEAMRADGGAELLGAVAPGKGAHWLRLEGWGHVPPSESAPRWRPTSARSAAVVRQWSYAWSTCDDRTTWLATLLTCIERPASIGDTALAVRVAAAMARVDAAPSTAALENATPAGRARTAAEPPPGAGGNHSQHPRNQADSPPHGASTPLAHADAHGSTDDVWRSSHAHPPADEAQEMWPGDRQARPEPALNDEGFFTPFAGIYFLVPVLERLKFATFLAAHPELLNDMFPTRLLWCIARKTGLPATDPLARAFEEQCSGTAQIEAVTPVALDAWVTAVRRWCRRHARVGLAALVRRPGRLHVSRTHIEAFFALSELDVRVRRSALDVDPGWVPWLGRVVQFTYGEAQ